MKTKAVLLRKSGMERPYAKSKPLTIETVELSPPGPDEVLVKIAAAGLCHSTYRPSTVIDHVLSLWRLATKPPVL